ncbi:MAG: hypothetical protein M1462_00300 [Candidatus Thermoplasmatota archaeon]|uniref:hypothetical protein n=1 Tax=Ferroplasma sp. Type II TaxID=261388 RepID=UPI00038951FC|nr:hypothetical protein [Ferroplasma sp. Type II]EQB74196.1 MAG: hypothetical protein AMDU4_FER2C00026G0002 [Ferroplasma sp. Type II]MCL4310860.1 hypothetical protein [Candidatus Thermoplasmatota archaeon]
MNYKQLARIFIILAILLSIIIFSIPAANHYGNSFILNTKNNITETYNNTTHYISQGYYSSAVFRTYGGELKLVPDQQATSGGHNYSVETYVSIYSINLHYNDTTANKIFGRNIENQIEIKLSAGYYMIRYNSTVTLYHNQSLKHISGSNFLAVTPPNDYPLIIAAYVLAIPTTIVGIFSGILYYKDKSKYS